MNFLTVQVVHCNARAEKVQKHDFLLLVVINMNGINVLKIWGWVACLFFFLL